MSDIQPSQPNSGAIQPSGSSREPKRPNPGQAAEHKKRFKEILNRLENSTLDFEEVLSSSYEKAVRDREELFSVYEKLADELEVEHFLS